MLRTSVPRRQLTLVQVLALLLAFVLTAGVGGLLTAGLVLPAVAAANAAVDLSVEAFEDLPSELEARPLSEKSFMLAADGTLLATFFAENREVVALTDVATVLQDAVVATEDRRFYQHGGIDPAGMVRALVQNSLNDSTQGASTLTQQYVKNALIESAVRDGDLEAANAAREADGAEGYARKLREAKLAIALEKELTKDQILEGYLNIAQFGVATYGVQSAAQRYFSKPASDLTYLEAATIAGITQSPTAFDPVKHPEKSQGRRDIVLGNMLREAFITQEEHDSGVATPLPDTLHVSEARSGCMAAADVIQGSGFFCDYVTRVIRNDPAFGETPQEREDRLYRGGLTITTTLDPRLQTHADSEVKNGVPVDDRTGVGSAITVVEPGTGYIKAMAQNRHYNNTADASGREVSVNYNTSFSYGGSGGFAPGSTYKPFTLLEWLKQGHNLSEQVNGTARTLDTNQFTACGARLGSSTWPVRNAEGGSGSMTIMDATRQSVNLAYLSMAMQLDLCSIAEGAAELGLVQAPHGVEGEPMNAYPSSVLGSDSTSPLAVAGAYAAFASGGTYCRPVAITNVKDPDGTDLPIPEAGCTQAIQPEIANAVNHALSNVWNGTGKAIGAPSGYTASGKTGTTSENEQTWFVGYTPRLATAVWVGYADSFTPMQRTTINGRYYRNVFGATIAGPTWKRFMDQALADGEPNPGFAPPDSTSIHGRMIPVPSVIGMDQASARAQLESAGFTVLVAGSVPSSVRAGSVASQSPSRSALPGATITLTLSDGAPRSQQGDTDQATLPDQDLDGEGHTGG
ncbi:penicillin-binding protein [Cellulosimicrobium cellulans]|uniref:penicillin-binding protein n=1 Tax=Cellulosimicrobium cellulans TaxID=1710 RepID=UPI00130D5959|nr:transglycosylase domain-containing protein [Cellulosimicrobium cellulans]